MTKRLTLYSSVTIIGLAAWYLFVFSPIHDKLGAVRAETVEVQNQVDDYNRTITELPSFLNKNAQLEELRGQLNSSLFAKDDILALFDHISNEATTYDLELVEITPPVSELLELNRQAANANTPQFLNITLHFKGGFVDFGRYLSRLEEKPYFRSVNSCIVRGGQVIQPAVDLSVSFKALIGTVEQG